jgi:hypothetical protein
MGTINGDCQSESRVETVCRGSPAAVACVLTMISVLTQMLVSCCPLAVAFCQGTLTVDATRDDYDSCTWNQT